MIPLTCKCCNKLRQAYDLLESNPEIPDESILCKSGGGLRIISIYPSQGLLRSPEQELTEYYYKQSRAGKKKQ
jgi:hypothetical protein